MRRRFLPWRWIESKLGGHISIGPLTLYGANAMHWGVNLKTRRWGYVCLRLPLPCFGRWWPLYFYTSPNATPWAATVLVGREYGRSEKQAAALRRLLWGHGFDSNDPTKNPQRPSAYLDAIVRILKAELSADVNDYPAELNDAWNNEMRAAHGLPLERS